MPVKLSLTDLVGEDSQPTNMSQVLKIIKQEYNLDIRDIIEPDQRPYVRLPGPKRKRLNVANSSKTSRIQSWKQLKPIEFLWYCEVISTAVNLRQQTTNAENKDVQEALTGDVKNAQTILTEEQLGLGTTVIVYCRNKEPVRYGFEKDRRGDKWRKEADPGQPESKLETGASRPDVHLDSTTAASEASLSEVHRASSPYVTPLGENDTHNKPTGEGDKSTRGKGEDEHDEEEDDDEDNEEDEDDIKLNTGEDSKPNAMDGLTAVFGEKTNMDEPSWGDDYAVLAAIKHRPRNQTYATRSTTSPVASPPPTDTDFTSSQEADEVSSTSPSSSEEDSAPVGDDRVAVHGKVDEAPTHDVFATISSEQLTHISPVEQQVEHSATDDDHQDHLRTQSPGIPESSFALQITHKAQSDPADDPGSSPSTSFIAPDPQQKPARALAVGSASVGTNNARESLEQDDGHLAATPVSTEQVNEVEITEAGPSTYPPQNAAQPGCTLKSATRHMQYVFSTEDQRITPPTLSPALVVPFSSLFSNSSMEVEVTDATESATEQQAEGIDTDGPSVKTADYTVPLIAMDDREVDMIDHDASQPDQAQAMAIDSDDLASDAQSASDALTDQAPDNDSASPMDVSMAEDSGLGQSGDEMGTRRDSAISLTQSPVEQCFLCKKIRQELCCTEGDKGRKHGYVVDHACKRRKLEMAM